MMLSTTRVAGLALLALSMLFLLAADPASLQDDQDSLPAPVLSVAGTTVSWPAIDGVDFFIVDWYRDGNSVSFRTQTENSHRFQRTAAR